MPLTNISKIELEFSPTEHKLLFDAMDYVSVDLFEFEEINISGQNKSIFSSAFAKVKSSNINQPLCINFTVQEIMILLSSMNYILDEISSNNMIEEMLEDEFKDLDAIKKLRDELQDCF